MKEFISFIEFVNMSDEEKYKLLNSKDYEIERLNKKIEQYENPEDMTLMFMWCDEKAKDEIKRLNNIINELEKWLIYKINKSGFEQDYERKLCYEDIFEELQELKGSDKE